MVIQGQVLEIETVQGTNNGEAYSYHRAHILDGLEVVQARVGDNYGPLPQKGSEITAAIRISIWNDRRDNGRARASYTLVAPYKAAQRAAAN